MQIWNDLRSYLDDSRPVVATIGNYDGVHLGHRKIVENVLAEARSKELPALLLTFDPHPLRVLAPDRPRRLLMTRRQKLEALEEVGIDGLLILRFDERLASLSGEDFFEELLDSRLRLESLQVGETFRFGNGRHGDLDLLRAIGKTHGFEVSGVPAVQIDGEVVSSSSIRVAVEQGDVERAWRLLGRPFALTGEVMLGEGRGKELQFPTANIDVENELTPKRGVYITETKVLSSRYPSVTNVGHRPTFGRGDLVVETHLLEFDADLYEERVSVSFLGRLRDEQRFSGPAELADQIARDYAAATAFFQNQQLRIR